MRLTKIYTKTGDRGNTSIVGGRKLSKASLRIEAYGSVDELNAFLGLLREEIRAHHPLLQDLTTQLVQIQNEMHDVCGELATPQDLLNLDRQQVVGEAAIARLEEEIDTYNATLAPLANFVLAGGCKENALAHVCRTICRRSERQVVALSQEEPVREPVMIYLNRLSDWLFVAGRIISSRLHAPEVLWKQKGK